MEVKLPKLPSLSSALNRDIDFSCYRVSLSKKAVKKLGKIEFEVSQPFKTRDKRKIVNFKGKRLSSFHF